MADEVVGLVDDTDRTGADGGSLGFGPSADGQAVDPDHAAVGTVEAGEAGEQCRLARARGPDHRDGLAGIGLKRYAAQGEHLLVAGMEEAVQLVCLEAGLSHADQEKESVTLRHGSTLSEPWGLERVSTASVPAFQNWYCSTSSWMTLPVTGSGGPSAR